MSYADGGPTRTAVLRGQRSYADSGPTRTAVLRGQRSCADSGPMRTAVLRGRRQRDLSLWTPLFRLRAGRGLNVLTHLYYFIPPKSGRYSFLNTNICILRFIVTFLR